MHGTKVRGTVPASRRPRRPGSRRALAGAATFLVLGQLSVLAANAQPTTQPVQEKLWGHKAQNFYFVTPKGKVTLPAGGGLPFEVRVSKSWYTRLMMEETTFEVVLRTAGVSNLAAAPGTVPLSKVVQGDWVRLSGQFPAQYVQPGQMRLEAGFHGGDVAKLFQDNNSITSIWFEVEFVAASGSSGPKRGGAQPLPEARPPPEAQPPPDAQRRLPQPEPANPRIRRAE